MIRACEIFNKGDFSGPVCGRRRWPQTAKAKPGGLRQMVTFGDILMANGYDLRHTATICGIQAAFGYARAARRFFFGLSLLW